MTGELVHIVHQYDRRKQLVASLGQRYILVTSPERPPGDPAPVDTTAALNLLVAKLGPGVAKVSSPAEL